jgi:hypothetical protein
MRFLNHPMLSIGSRFKILIYFWVSKIRRTRLKFKNVQKESALSTRACEFNGTVSAKQLNGVLWLRKNKIQIFFWRSYPKYLILHIRRVRFAKKTALKSALFLLIWDKKMLEILIFYLLGALCCAEHYLR